MAELERRSLHFESVDEILAEVERLVQRQVRTSGRYSFAQILEHLARVLDIVTGHRPGPHVPLVLRGAARLARSLVINRPMKPGLKLPSAAQAAFWPEDSVELSQSLPHFREALDRFVHAESLPTHPVFGDLTRVQHERLQCRHCELHLSFVHPND